MVSQNANRNFARVLSVLVFLSMFAGMAFASVATVSTITSTNASGSYNLSKQIFVNVTFNESVDVNTAGGSPRILLNSSGTSYAIYFVGPTPAFSHLFRYTVADGDNANPLDYVNKSTSLSLNGGSINSVSGGEASNLTLPAEPGAAGSLGDALIVIDTVVPGGAAVTTTKANGTYTVGESIGINVTFNQTVYIVGSAYLDLNSGGYAVYSSGNGSATLTFTYVVEAGQNSTALAYNATSSLHANGSSTIRDNAGNNAILTLPATTTFTNAHAIVIDTAGPTVSSVNTNTPNGAYMAGGLIQLNLTFSEAAILVGAPTIDLNSGGTAVYDSGNNTTVFTFNYTVVAGQTSSDLTYNLTSSLGLNGGTLKDAVGNNANTTLPDPAVFQGAHAIVVDTTAPTVSAVNSTTADGSYNASKVISLYVTFPEAVYVVGAPLIALDTAGNAVYASGNGTANLTFNYTVGASDISSDLGYNNTTALSVNGGTMKDLAGNDLNVTLATDSATFRAEHAIVIDTTAPSITTVAATPNSGKVAIGETITLNITSDATGYTSGSITVNNVATTGFADGGDNTYTAVYTVVEGNTARDVGTTPVSVVLRDAAGNTNTAETSVTGGITGVDATRPAVSFVNTTAANGTYGPGQVLLFNVTFGEAVYVVGTPYLALNSTGNAYYASGNGTTDLIFNYTVGATGSGQDASVLSHANNSSFTLNGSTILDAEGNSANLNLTAPADFAAEHAIAIDTTAPTISPVNTNTPNGAYKAGGLIQLNLTFSEVTIMAGAPTIDLNSGGTAAYSSGNNTTVFTFNYTVASGQDSADLTYNLTSSLGLNGGTLMDAVGNNANTTLPDPSVFQGAHAIVVDTTAPTVLSVNTTTADGSYKADAVISFYVPFSEAVYVVGAPLIALDTGGNAVYASGNGTANLTFNYTVGASDTSSDLGYNNTTALSVNGGTMKDLAGNDLNVTLATDFATFRAEHAIVIDTTVPTVSTVNSTTADGAYNASKVISLYLTFSEAVYVTGAPYIDLNSGGNASYASGNGTANLTFNYTVQAGHVSADLTYNATNSLQLNSGTMTDLAGNNLTTTLPNPATFAAQHAIVIDTTAPSITSFTASPTSGKVAIGGTITLNITSDAVGYTSGSITVNGVATTGFADGGDNTYAAVYTVVEGNTARDVNATPVSVVLRDAAGNTNTASTSVTGDIAGVDATRPAISAANTTTPDTTYGAGGLIQLNLTFSEAVILVGAPTIALNSGGTAAYDSGNNTTVLTFNYTVAAGQDSSDLTYNLTSSLGLNGGTLRDATGNDANITLPDPATFAAQHAIVVDTTSPTILAANTTTANGYYKAGTLIQLNLTFSEAVALVGAPTIALNSGGTAAYDSGNNTTVLTFNYTVGAGQGSSDLTYNLTSSLGLNGGTLKDATGNDANTTLPDPAIFQGQHAIVVDTTVPTVSAVDSDGQAFNTGTASPHTITVTFSENMSVGPTISIISPSQTIVPVVNNCGDALSTTFCFAYTIPSATADTMTLNISGAQDMATNPMAANSSHTFDVDTIVPAVTASSPQGTTTASSPVLINVTTSIAANCRYDFQDRSYATMAYNFSTGQNTTAHSSNVTLTTQGLNNIYVTCAGLNGSAMVSSVRLYTTYDTTSNFNYTQTLNLGWNNMWLPRVVLQNLSSLGGNYSVVNVLNTNGGIGGNYSYLYYRNGTSCSAQNGSCWLSYDPSSAVNSLTVFNDWDNLPYWIHMNASDRLELQ
jgi:hypothetical protein